MILRWLAHRLDLVTREDLARAIEQAQAQINTAQSDASAAQETAQLTSDDFHAFAEVLRANGFTVNSPR